MTVQDDGNVDLIGKRRNGGADLFIVTSNGLDGSIETQKLLKNKLQTYLDAILTDEFQAEFGRPERDRISIVLVCVGAPASEIEDLVEQLVPFFLEHGVSLRIDVRA